MIDLNRPFSVAGLADLLHPHVTAVRVPMEVRYLLVPQHQAGVHIVVRETGAIVTRLSPPTQLAEELARVMVACTNAAPMLLEVAAAAAAMVEDQRRHLMLRGDALAFNTWLNAPATMRMLAALGAVRA